MRLCFEIPRQSLVTAQSVQNELLCQESPLSGSRTLTSTHSLDPGGGRWVFSGPAPARSANRLRVLPRGMVRSARGVLRWADEGAFLLPAPTRSASRLRRRIFARSCAMVAARAPSSASPVLGTAVDLRGLLHNRAYETPIVRICKVNAGEP